jgi:hypothetical protein
MRINAGLLEIKLLETKEITFGKQNRLGTYAGEMSRLTEGQLKLRRHQLMN